MYVFECGTVKIAYTAFIYSFILNHVFAYIYIIHTYMLHILHTHALLAIFVVEVIVLI